VVHGHCVSPVAPGDARVMLRMTYCTDSQLGHVQEVTRRLQSEDVRGIVRVDREMPQAGAPSHY
jgi:hypothetical protein